MKARVKATRKEITIIDSDMSIFDTNGSLYYLSDLTFINDEPNWEQRRYEIAKDVLAAQISDTEYAENNSEQMLAKYAVRYADALIEELKGGEQ